MPRTAIHYCECGSEATFMLKHECLDKKNWKCTGYRATCDAHLARDARNDRNHADKPITILWTVRND